VSPRLIQKITRGERPHVTRLQDEKGNHIAASTLIRHLPRAIVSSGLRLLCGKRPVLPWIAYDAIDKLDRFLKPHHIVMEYGSGMSTIWFAQRVARVVSVESNAAWFEQVGHVLEARGLRNVERHMLAGGDYATPPTAERQFDLILVDGERRGECVAQAISMINPGGIIYLDNSDKDSTPVGGDMRRAESALLNFARNRGAQVRYFVDLSPTQLFVQQGLMVRMRS